MWPLASQLSLIRYLIVWRVNGAFVQLPRYLPVELSQVLGTLIAERLPSAQAKPWHKALGAAAAAPSALPAWPVETVIRFLPGKRACGPGEPLLWELKLLGDAADHGFFLEVLLPAMEAGATTSDERWHRPRTLWGRFDIQAVYVARGAAWEPLVTDGRLDLAYRATPAQWAERLDFDTPPAGPLHRLTWQTPFDLGSGMGDAVVEQSPDNPQSPNSHSRPPKSRSQAPSLCDLLDAFMARAATLLLSKWATPEQAWAALDVGEREAVRQACAEGQLQQQSLAAPPRDWPGRWIGAQRFSSIPPRSLPYLELASILHIGKLTHLGCGTFSLE